MQQLEQLIYQPTRTTTQKSHRNYTPANLESMPAVALYTGEPCGTSDYMTWLADPQPMADLEIQNSDSYKMANTEGVTVSSLDSLTYINGNRKLLGGITSLNESEMKLLVKKHFDL